MPTENVDVVIIGSGYGGSIPAARLAEAGLRVVVLERGARLATSDLRQSDAPAYIQTMTDVVVSSRNIAYRTGKLVGGASIPMDGAMFRMPQHSFETAETSGRRYWPSMYSRAFLDPYYARAEQMFGVRQFAWSEIPKAGGLFAKMLDRAGATCERARMNYTDCVHCGFCAQGCIFDKKKTLLHTYIPLAEQHGAEFRSGCEAQLIVPDAAPASGWTVRYTRNGENLEIHGAKLFIAAGGLFTPALLLRSRSQLTRLNEHVGENFNHNGEKQYCGILPADFDNLDEYRCFKGMDNAGMMTFHWYESHGFTLHPGGGMEPTLFAATIAAENDPVVPQRAWGMEFKRFVENVYPHRVIGFSSLGLADSHSAVQLKADGKTPDVVDRDATAYNAYLDRMESVLADISTRTGVKIIPGYPRRYSGMTSAHLLSACRMSESAADGVVDPNCKVWGYENLYVCDASAIPYALGVNPALNISAVAEHCVERVIAQG